MDQRGFGFSAGRRGFFESVESHLSDLSQHIKLIDAKYGAPGLKRSLIGTSMGGHMALRVSMAFPPGYFSSIALLAPYLGLKNEIPPETVEEIERLDLADPHHKMP